MRILQSISLDFGRDTLPVTVYAKQNDTKTRYVEITPLNRGQIYTLESGITPRLQLTKPDGHTVINDAQIEEGLIIAELTVQALAAEGVAVAEIGLYKNDELLSSQTFYIDIKRTAYDKDAPESSDEYNSLVKLFGDVETAKENAEDAVESANTAVVNANAATERANTAVSGANTATEKANAAANAANTAKSNAEQATNAANVAATNANAAKDNANSAANAANTAKTNAEKATADANTAAANANTAKNNADTATSNANTAKEAAEEATENANNAAAAAMEAAGAVGENIDGITIVDTDNGNQAYLAKLRVIGGYPAIEFTKI